MMEAAQFRYPGVQPFRTDQAHLFFGREEDIFRLYSQVEGEELTVLFGKSGYGKSSLLQAGLLPKLMAAEKTKRTYWPVVIRFNNYSEENNSLFRQYFFHVGEALKAQPLKPATNLPSTLPDTLWGNWKRYQLSDRTTIVLIFDQFEEFFSFPLAEQITFTKQLAELLYSDYPQYLDREEATFNDQQYEHLSEPLDTRVVFAIRSDRLSELNALHQYLPAILHKRIELAPLPPEQARAAITGPALLGSTREQEDALSKQQIIFRSPAFTYREAALDELINRLQQPNANGKVGVEAFLLQVICNEIEASVEKGSIKGRNSHGLLEVNTSDLPNTTKVFTEYYERRLAPFPAELQQVVREVIENGLVQINESGEGRRLSVDGGALLNNYKKKGLTEALLQELVGTFLLRREPNSLGGLNYELSHDVLLEPVIAARRKREETILAVQKVRELEAERKKRRSATLLAIVGFTLALLAIITSLYAYQQNQLAQLKTREAEQATAAALDQANAAQLAEEQTRTVLLRLQKAEADKVLAEVAAIEERARQMKNRNYPLVYRAMMQDVISILEQYRENPILQDKLRAVEQALQQK